MNRSNDVTSVAKQLGTENNVSIRVLDRATGRCVQEHVGHNAATNSMITGIAHYLAGDGILNQGVLGHGVYTIKEYLPNYISLGTMGLYSQDSDANGLPTGIGIGPPPEHTEIENFKAYMNQVPGYGADGYDENENNNRMYFGLGPMFPEREDQSKTINCELISPSYPRAQITFRDIVPEQKSELPCTIDVVFSTMISTGSLRQFREEGKDYIFITEAGLWSKKSWEDSGDNGLLAAYRIIPPSEGGRDMSSAENREILRRNIIRVGINQVVQVIWKIQLGSVSEFGGIYGTRPIIWTVT
jgi:hypothetical protein